MPKKYVSLTVAVLLAVSAHSSFAEEAAPDSRFRERVDFADGLYAREMYDMAYLEYEAIRKEFASRTDLGPVGFRAAESLFFGGKYAEAAEAYRAFVRRYPETPQAETANARVGEALYRMGKPAEAKQHLAALLESSAPDARRIARYVTARADTDAGDWASARTNFEAVAGRSADNPFWAYATFFLGEIAFAEKRFGDALKSYDAALSSGEAELGDTARFGKGKALFALGRWADARAVFAELADTAKRPDLAEDAFLNELSSIYRLADWNALIAKLSEFAKRLRTPAKAAAARFLAADGFAKLGRYPEAAAVLDAVVAASDASAEDKEKAELKKAELLVEGGNLTGALELLKVLEKDRRARADRVLLQESAIYEKFGQFLESLKPLDALLTGHPNSDLYREALLRKGYVLVRMDKPRRARSVLKHFIEKYPDSEAAEKAAADVVSLDAKAEEPGRAIEDARAFLERYPRSSYAARIHLRLGAFYSEKGLFEKAREVYQKHLEAYPSENPAELVLMMGLNEERAKQDKAALEFYDKALERGLAPDSAYAALKNGAACALRLKDSDGAARRYERILSEFPHEGLETAAVFWLAEHAVDKASSEGLKRVVDYLESRPDAASHAAEIAYYRGEELRLEGKRAEAIPQYTLAAAPDSPVRADALFAMGRARAEMGDAALARASLEEAGRVAPDDPEIGLRSRFELARLDYLEGRYTDAAKGFMSVAILYDDARFVPEALFKAGESFEKSGDGNAARKAYSELLERFAGHALAREAKGKLQKETVP